ncbi:BON domain-containing protein [Nitrosomonas sp.]|uniref:BON domain-containing protein n=1 Tax=Nitrosomonas sp. TaxID=42353 RepID=UPI0025CEC0E1|nr:BON domain-containing protein [Nitrosomonas sp.]
MTQLSNHFIAFLLSTQMVFFAGCIATPKQADTSEQFNDIVITTKIHEAILDEPSLRAFDINIRTSKGVVELSGLVNSRDDMNKTISIARSVNGIKFIKNDMRIPGTGDY